MSYYFIDVFVAVSGQHGCQWALKDRENKKRNGYGKAFQRFRTQARPAHSDFHEAWNNMQQINQRSSDDGLFGSVIGHPTVIPFGMSTDGHLSASANSFLRYLSEVKFGADNFVEGSAEIARAQWIARWVLKLRAGVVRASSEALHLGLAYLRDWRGSGRTCEGENNDAYTQRSQASSASSFRPPARIVVGNTTFPTVSAVESST